MMNSGQAYSFCGVVAEQDVPMDGMTLECYECGAGLIGKNGCEYVVTYSKSTGTVARLCWSCAEQQLVDRLPSFDE